MATQLDIWRNALRQMQANQIGQAQDVMDMQAANQQPFTSPTQGMFHPAHLRGMMGRNRGPASRTIQNAIGNAFPNRAKTPEQREKAMRDILIKKAEERVSKATGNSDPFSIEYSVNVAKELSSVDGQLAGGYLKEKLGNISQIAKTKGDVLTPKKVAADIGNVQADTDHRIMETATSQNALLKNLAERGIQVQEGRLATDRELTKAQVKKIDSEVGLTDHMLRIDAYERELKINEKNAKTQEERNDVARQGQLLDLYGKLVGSETQIAVANIYAKASEGSGDGEDGFNVPKNVPDEEYHNFKTEVESRLQAMGVDISDLDSLANRVIDLTIKKGAREAFFVAAQKQIGSEEARQIALDGVVGLINSVVTGEGNIKEKWFEKNYLTPSGLAEFGYGSGNSGTTPTAGGGGPKTVTSSSLLDED